VFERVGVDGRPKPTTSKDGITVLNSMSFDSPIARAVHFFAQQAAAHSVIASGDGPQPMYSKVLTPKGFVSMSDVKVGLKICGTDGTIQEVVGIFPKGEKEIYQVEFSGKRIVECCADHLWTVFNSLTARKDPMETKTTLELSKDYASRKKGQLVSKYCTPQSAVEFYTNEAEMPLDPYLVGVLLGDGSLSGTGAIEISLGKSKEHILKKLVLPEGTYLNTQFVDRKNYFRVKLNGRTKNGKSMAQELESIGLLGTKSSTKFIPKSYLYSSVENRKALLQGLIDTDGHINKRGRFEFSSVGKEMAKDFEDLCRSLGLSVLTSCLNRKEGNGSYSDKPIYRVSELVGYKHGDKILKITPTGKTTAMQCIKVSNHNNLYITDGYIATHNTTSTLVLANAVAKAIMGVQNKRWGRKQIPQAMARQLRKEAKAAIEAIRSEADMSPEMVRKVALTSSNGDEELVEVASEAVKMTSAFGTVLLEKSPSIKKRYDVSKQDGFGNMRGYNWNNTFALSCSDLAAENSPFEWDHPYVMVFNGNLMVQQQLDAVMRAYQKTMADGKVRKLLIVCHETTDEMANKLIVFNRKSVQSGAGVFIVKPQLTAEVNSSLQILRDISSYTGASIIDGGSYETTSPTDFGTCEKVRVSPTQAIMLGRGPNHWVEKRVQQNANLAEAALSVFDQEIVSIRNAELAEGLVTVTIGGGHLTDLQERADRLDDAIKASQACIRSGALPGCGASFIRAGHLAKVSVPFQKALAVVHEQIMENFGASPVNKFENGQTVKIGEDETTRGDFRNLGISDATETVVAVITNGVELGITIALMGGYCLSGVDSKVEVSMDNIPDFN
jgi:chaperonin GroEL (HSP60 family)